MKLQFLNLKQRYNLKDYKFTLILLVLAVSVIGVFMVGSANAEYQPRQIMGVGLGLLAMVVISLIDYKWILNFYWLMYVVNIALLLAVIFLWDRGKWCDKMAGSWICAVSAFRSDKIDHDLVFCQIFG
ncbi:MAG: hypothetical protein ACLRMN_10325 [Mediterraneibacter gnavus]